MGKFFIGFVLLLFSCCSSHFDHFIKHEGEQITFALIRKLDIDSVECYRGVRVISSEITVLFACFFPPLLFNKHNFTDNKRLLKYAKKTELRNSPKQDKKKYYKSHHIYQLFSIKPFYQRHWAQEISIDFHTQSQPFMVLSSIYRLVSYFLLLLLWPAKETLFQTNFNCSHTFSITEMCFYQSGSNVYTKESFLLDWKNKLRSKWYLHSRHWNTAKQQQRISSHFLMFYPVSAVQCFVAKTKRLYSQNFRFFEKNNRSGRCVSSYQPKSFW